MAADKELKDLLKALADGVLLVSEVSQGFSFQEVTQLVGLVFDIKQVATDAPLLLAQYKALDDAAKADLIAYIDTNVKFPANTQVELVIEKILEALVMLSGLLSLFVK